MELLGNVFLRQKVKHMNPLAITETLFWQRISMYAIACLVLKNILSCIVY